MPRLLTFDELRDHGVPFTRGHIHKLETEGKFPKRVPIGSFRIGWVEEEIDAWVTEKIEARSTNAGTIGSTGSIKGRVVRPTRPND